MLVVARTVTFALIFTHGSTELATGDFKSATLYRSEIFNLLYSTLSLGSQYEFIEP